MTLFLSLIFFVSGASALIFEILWFQLSGLMLGNSVYATSVVLAGFMGGLALGNTLSAFWGYKIRFPVKFYAILEILIAISGFSLILLFPRLTALFAPFFRLLTEAPVILNLIRSLIALLLMLIPATAMGATLPILVKALNEKEHNFGRVLGVLYGWNTLGAMAGVIIAEMILIKQFGITGTGIVAVILNTIAAILALSLSRMSKEVQLKGGQAVSISAIEDFSSRRLRILAASFLSGFSLLALEVIWFRFLLLFYLAHIQNFAVMLATVLGGISIGGIFASTWFKYRPQFQNIVMPLLLMNGAAVILLYSAFGGCLDYFVSTKFGIISASLFLIFPISFFSGMIFTMIGKILFAEMGDETKATGLLTLANTVGGMAGALLSGLVFLPFAGLEKSFFILGLVYAVIAALIYDREKIANAKGIIMVSIILVGVFFVSILFFPFGRMENVYSKNSWQWASDSVKRVGIREGLTETVQYLQGDLMGEPYFHHLVTNNFVMSSTKTIAKRYMKMFVYLPVAIHPNPEKALLICYGCGSTAKALTDTRFLKKIDIVDTSKDILEMSRIIYPDPKENPVNDPRVRTHIEDGRFYLLTTVEKYDLITGEPPPAQFKGVSNIYNQEYFQLIYDRLEDGGMCSYWLPCAIQSHNDSKAIIKAFMNVFEESSLWMGAGLNYIMLGIKKPAQQVSEKRFCAQWKDNVVGDELRLLGFLSPEQFGSLFIADGDRLERWVTGVEPLVDEYPHRASDPLVTSRSLADYRALETYEHSLKNFLSSRLVAAIWPDRMIQKAAIHFPTRQIISDINLEEQLSATSDIVELHTCIQDPDLKPYILWSCFSDSRAQYIIMDQYLKKGLPAAESDPGVLKHLAARAAQQGRYAEAENYFAMHMQALGGKMSMEYRFKLTAFRMYLSFIAGKKGDAREIGEEYINIADAGQVERRVRIANYLEWLSSVIP